MDFSYHRLDLQDPYFRGLVRQPSSVGLPSEWFHGLTGARRDEAILGEYFARLSQELGRLSSELLFNAQWGHIQPEWFDHRHHVMNPERWWTDFWTASADNVMEVLPLNGRLLEYCSGDGFYDYYFYRKRASLIVCVDADKSAHAHAIRLHSAPNIEYHNTSIFDHQVPAESFDVVAIRGAIEHFSSEDQLRVFKRAYDALRVGGYFCGDTPANPDKSKKMLHAHEFEWADEQEMREQLSHMFKSIETRTMESRDRTTLFWQCQK